MDRQSVSLGSREKFSNTAIKWSPHAANILALGSAENFGVVGKGIVQIKKIEGNSLVTVAALEEKVS